MLIFPKVLNVKGSKVWVYNKTSLNLLSGFCNIKLKDTVDLEPQGFRGVDLTQLDSQNNCHPLVSASSVG